MTRYLAPTSIVAKHFTELTGLKCDVAPNPIIIDKPQKVLRLISATRLSKEKGFDRMCILLRALEKSGIPFVWTIFTNDTNEERIRELDSNNIIFMKPRLDITPYIADSDYLVQLSNDGEGFGYTPCEALVLGIPVIVTPVASFKEIGIKDGENGFILDFDMSNIDIQKIYKSHLKFKYEPPRDIYGDLLEGKSNYDYETTEDRLVQCIKPYTDYMTLETKTELDKPYTLDKERAEFLQERGYVKIL